MSNRENGAPAPESEGVMTKKKKGCKPSYELATPTDFMVELRGIEPLAS
jgi:hypothetical protein